MNLCKKLNIIHAYPIHYCIIPTRSIANEREATRLEEHLDRRGIRWPVLDWNCWLVVIAGKDTAAVASFGPGWTLLGFGVGKLAGRKLRAGYRVDINQSVPIQKQLKM